MAGGWTVRTSRLYRDWRSTLRPDERDRLQAAIDVLEILGPGLGRPLVDTVKTSAHRNMKELRVLGTRIRVLFIFDRSSTAVLLIGGDKSGNWVAWYRENVPLADEIYARYLESIPPSPKAARRDRPRRRRR